MLGIRITRAVSSVVERLLHTQEVAGSNPASRTMSSLGYLGRKGRREKFNNAMFGPRIAAVSQINKPNMAS